MACIARRARELLRAAWSALRPRLQRAVGDRKGAAGPPARIPEIVEAARAQLDPVLWDYACGGAESEVTLRLDWLRSLTHLPFMLKGVLHPEDAALAVDKGVDVVYVSNHGGRQLDHAPATVEMLPDVVRAVGGRAEVVVDGGFLRGSDVVAALALGARAVLIGRLQVWALAAAGEDGLVRTLQLLREEIQTTMATLGAHKVAELSQDMVVASPQPSFP